MDIPKTIDQKAAQKLLEGLGYTRAKKSKQHAVKMVQDGRPPITLPYHKGAVYGKDLTADILRQAGVKGHARERQQNTSHVSRDHQ